MVRILKSELRSRTPPSAPPDHGATPSNVFHVAEPSTHDVPGDPSFAPATTSMLRFPERSWSAEKRTRRTAVTRPLDGIADKLNRSHKNERSPIGNWSVGGMPRSKFRSGSDSAMPTSSVVAEREFPEFSPRIHLTEGWNTKPR